MKINFLKQIFPIIALCAFLTSCSKNRHEEIVSLMEDDEEWSAEQTQKAIDIYIEGLNEQIDIMETYQIINEKINLEDQWEYRAKKRSFWKDRKDDIKEAQKKLKNTDKELTKKYKLHSRDDNDY